VVKADRIDLGIMQGRLCDKPGRLLQSFPEHSWRDEFKRAAALGFDALEWLLDGATDNDNPITTPKGRKLILELCREYGVRVSSLCAHTFINGAILEKGSTGRRSQNHLWKVLDWAHDVQIKFVVLPAMDKMSLKTRPAYERFLNIFQDKLRGSGPILLLESDLEADKIKTLIRNIGSTRLGVLYDLGNANALGFDVKNDLTLLHDYIYEIHIKDRFSSDGASVRLGEGDTPFSEAADALAKLRWKGPFILETPIFDNWQIEARHNIKFAQKWISSLGGSL
jgi:L-ribulose-5-phosphate 3-epimerase